MNLAQNSEDVPHPELNGDGKRTALLVITIPTHVRVMLDVASLLQASQRWTPEIVYYPNAVYQQNCGDCQGAPHEVHIWNGAGFDHITAPEASTGVGAGAQAAAASHRAANPDVPAETTPFDPALVAGRAKSSRRACYEVLHRGVPFVPSPETIVRGVLAARLAIYRYVVPTVRRAAMIIGFARFTLKWVAKGLPMPAHLASRPAESRLKRFFLALFDSEWNTALRDPSIKHAIGHSHTAFFRGVATQAAIYREFRALVESRHAALVILPEENLFYAHHLMVHAAHAQDVPSVVVPFTIANSLEWAEAFFALREYRANAGWNRWLSRAFPEWVLTHRGRRLILPPTHVASSEWFDIVPLRPWVINSGAIDGIACESAFMHEYYVKAGIAPAKLHTTGTLADDKLYASLLARDAQREALAARLGVTMRDRVLLIGLPPDQFGGGKRDGVEFDRYDELIRFMVDVTTSGNDEWTVLINLHPRVRREDVSFLESCGATIVGEPIEALVPLADIYIAVVSATIRLAVSCGIPVINYDAYQYDYIDYKALPGVREVKTRSAYESAVRELRDDPRAYAAAADLQMTTARTQCEIDGQAGTRMLALFDKLAGVPAEISDVPVVPGAGSRSRLMRVN